MSIPLYIFLIPYGLFLIFFAVMAISALYHIIRFAFINATTVTVTIIFIAVSFVFLTISLNYLNETDWQKGIEIGFGIPTPQPTEETNDIYL